MVVLGIVIERPGETASGIAHLVGRRFAYTRWSRSAAYNALPPLLKQGSVRRVYHAPGRQRSFDRYEATDEGVVDLREWVRASSNVPVALREALHGRVEFSELDDLPALIESLRVELEVCKKEYVESRRQLHVVEASGPSRGASWSEIEIEAAVLSDQSLIWWQRIERLRRLSQRLEEILGCDELDAGGNGG